MKQYKINKNGKEYHVFAKDEVSAVKKLRDAEFEVGKTYTTKNGNEFTVTAIKEERNGYGKPETYVYYDFTNKTSGNYGSSKSTISFLRNNTKAKVKDYSANISGRIGELLDTVIKITGEQVAKGKVDKNAIRLMFNNGIEDILAGADPEQSYTTQVNNAKSQLEKVLSKIKDSAIQDKSTYKLAFYNDNWYYEITNDDGSTKLVGPYSSAQEARVWFAKHRPNDKLQDKSVKDYTTSISDDPSHDPIIFIFKTKQGNYDYDSMFTPYNETHEFKSKEDAKSAAISKLMGLGYNPDKFTFKFRDKSVFSPETMSSVQEGIEKDYASMRTRMSKMYDLDVTEDDSILDKGIRDTKYTIKSTSDEGEYYLVNGWEAHKTFWVKKADLRNNMLFNSPSHAKASLTKLLKIMPEYANDKFESVEIADCDIKDSKTVWEFWFTPENLKLYKTKYVKEDGRIDYDKDKYTCEYKDRNVGTYSTLAQAQSKMKSLGLVKGDEMVMHGLDSDIESKVFATNNVEDKIVVYSNVNTSPDDTYNHLLKEYIINKPFKKDFVRNVVKHEYKYSDITGLTREQYDKLMQAIDKSTTLKDSAIKDSYKNYKGYDIEYNFYGRKEYTVQYLGDDVWFNTEQEAKKFIDEITSKKDSAIKDDDFIQKIKGRKFRTALDVLDIVRLYSNDYRWHNNPDGTITVKVDSGAYKIKFRYEPLVDGKSERVEVAEVTQVNDCDIRDDVKFRSKLEPRQRHAVDNKVWWVPYDTVRKEYTDCTLFGKYATKWACQYDIDLYTKQFPELFAIDTIKDSASKPEFEALGKWDWDEVKQDWFDTGRKMYYTEIVRNSGGNFGKYPMLDSKCNDADLNNAEREELNFYIEYPRYIKQDIPYITRRYGIKETTVQGVLKEIKKLVGWNIQNLIKDVEPNKDESKEDFISRFMSETKEEYPDEKQRYAVANSYWERRNLKDTNPLVEVRRDIEKLKKRLSGKPVRENFGEEEIRKLENKYSQYYTYMYLHPYRELFDQIQDFRNWCRNYTG